MPSTNSGAVPDAPQGPCDPPAKVENGTVAAVQLASLKTAQRLLDCSATKVESEKQWERIVRTYERNLAE